MAQVVPRHGKIEKRNMMSWKGGNASRSNALPAPVEQKGLGQGSGTIYTSQPRTSQGQGLSKDGQNTDWMWRGLGLWREREAQSSRVHVLDPGLRPLPQGHSQIQGEYKNNLSSWWQCGQCSNRGMAVTSVTAAGNWGLVLPTAIPFQKTTLPPILGAL